MNTGSGSLRRWKECSLSCELGCLVLALLLTSCVTFAELTDISGLSFLLCKMKDLNFNKYLYAVVVYELHSQLYTQFNDLASS